MENVDLIWLQKQNIEWDNYPLGVKSGVVNRITVSDKGVELYCVSFGQSTSLKLEDMNKTWRVR